MSLSLPRLVVKGAGGPAPRIQEPPPAHVLTEPEARALASRGVVEAHRLRPTAAQMQAPTSGYPRGAPLVAWTLALLIPGGWFALGAAPAACVPTGLLPSWTALVDAASVAR